MKVESNNESIEVANGQLSRFEGVDLIGKGYKDPVRPWTQILNENFLNLASKLKGVFVTLSEKADRADVHTKEEVNTLLTQRIASLLGSAPEAYDTLSEIAAKLQSDDNALSVINEILQNKANTNHTHTNDHTHLNKSFLDGLSQETLDNKSNVTHTHSKKYFSSKNTQQVVASGEYIKAFTIPYSSLGISANSDGSSIVFPAGVYLVDVSFSYVTFTAAGSIMCGLEYGGVIFGSIYSYSSTYTGNNAGAGRFFTVLVSDGVKALKLKCGGVAGSPSPLIITSIVEL